MRGKCTKELNLPMVRRWVICLVLGVVFGFMCAWGRLVSTPDLLAMTNYWWSVEMWEMVFNRFLLGFVVFLAGDHLWCPITGIRFFPWMRGAMIGLLVSLTGSFSVLAQRGDWNGFWAILVAGILFGVIIDSVATIYGGEGERLLDSCCEKKKKWWGREKI